MQYVFKIRDTTRIPKESNHVDSHFDRSPSACCRLVARRRPTRRRFERPIPIAIEEIDIEFPVSSWEDCDAALDAAVDAAHELRHLPTSQIAEFFERYADRIDAAKDALVEVSLSRNRTGQEPSLGRRRIASHQQPVASRSCCLPKRELGVANDRHRGRNSILL